MQAFTNITRYLWKGWGEEEGCDITILKKGQANRMLNPEDKCLNWQWGSFWRKKKKNNFHQERDAASLRAPPKTKKKRKKNETYSFASSIPLFQYCSLLVPPPHIIKHIIITWLSARASPRSVLALPGNQFVVTLCNPSKVIKWNELQLQRAFKNTGEREGGRRVSSCGGKWKGEGGKKKKREKWQHSPGIFHRLIAHPRSWRWNINAQFVYLRAHISPVPSC